MLRCGPLSLNPATRVVLVADEVVDLSTREFTLLDFLLRHPGRVLSRTRIVEGVWGHDYDGFSNVVDVYVKYLRHKIDRRFDLELRQTVRGAGYRLVRAEPER